MATARLTVTFDGTVVLPHLRRVKATPVGDELTVRMVTGQIPDDYAAVGLRPTHTFGARSCRVAPGRRPDLVVLTLQRADTLATTVQPALSPPVPDLDGLIVGRVEEGTPLRLRLSGDRAYGAHILANMATQAVFMGKPSEAVQLSCAAVEAAKRSPANVMARLHTAEACAQAVAGNAAATYRALAAAESAMGRQPANGPEWAGYFTQAHFAGTAVRCLRDLKRPKEALAYAESAMMIASGGTRTEALHAALVGTIHAEHGDLDRACDLAETAFQLAPHIRSTRVENRIHSLVKVLGRQPAGSRAGDLAARGRALLAAGVP
jgi:hypothetical protein